MRLQSKSSKRQRVVGTRNGNLHAMYVTTHYMPLLRLTPIQKFQDLEEERLDFTKSSLWSYANIASTVCVSDDAVSDVHFPLTILLSCSSWPSPARRFASHWRTVKSRRTSAALSRKRAPGKKSRTLQNTSTSVAGTSMTRAPKFQRKRATLWRSFSVLSIRHSEVRLRSRRHTNLTMTRSRIWPRKWAILLLQPLRAERQLSRHKNQHHKSQHHSPSRNIYLRSLYRNSKHHSSQRRWTFAAVGSMANYHRTTIQNSTGRSGASLTMRIQLTV